jgi:predicted transcriptional regulator
MPNLYKRTLGKRKYHDFSKEDLEKALREIRSKKMSMVEAAEHYNISKSTLWRKLKNLHMKKHGGQTVLTKMEEDNISEIILFAADWGYPLEKDDVNDLIQSYLDRKGTKMKGIFRQ